MKTAFNKLAQWVFVVVVFAGVSACSTSSSSAPAAGGAQAASSNTPVSATPSGTISIDETQIMWMVGGDIGGGTLYYQGQTYGFKMDGLKLGGFGMHQVDLDGDVWDMNALDDFAGVYVEAEAGYTVVDSGKDDVWLKNKKGVKLRLKSPKSKGLALNLGVDGIDIRLK